MSNLDALESFARPVGVPQETPREAFFAEQHHAEYEWIQTSTFDFALKMRDVLKAWGRLTEGQLRAVQKCMSYEKSLAERRALGGMTPKQTEVVLKYQAEDTHYLDLTKLPSGLYAVPYGDTRLKVRVQRGQGRWQGYIFVTDGAVYGQSRQYGRQAPGGTYKGQIFDQMLSIARDPKAASAAYGRLTGTCGVCGRHLEDKDSVERGIGPVCADRMGW